MQWLFIAVTFTLTAAAAAQPITVPQAPGAVTLPWGEFEALYLARLEAQRRDRELPPALYVLHSADYRLELGADTVSGRVSLSGRLLRGAPEPIPLFGHDLTVTGVEAVDGATLLSDRQGYRLLPQSGADFTLSLQIALPVREDRRSWLVELDNPAAVLNTLTLQLSDGLQLLDAPGLRRADDSYGFGAGEPLRLRFTTTADGTAGDGAAGDIAADPGGGRTVLDAAHLYVQYTENGSALTLLRLELPAQSGSELRLRPRPGAELWSLTVNGQARQPRRDGDVWWVTLGEAAALVEFSYLRKGPPLGLQGRLEFATPQVSLAGGGLAARQLKVAVALAERVELVALQGELEAGGPNTDNGKDWPQVHGFPPNAYRFSYPFYRGGVLEAAIHYQEPLHATAGAGS